MMGVADILVCINTSNSYDLYICCQPTVRLSGQQNWEILHAYLVRLNTITGITSDTGWPFLDKLALIAPDYPDLDMMYDSTQLSGI